MDVRDSSWFAKVLLLNNKGVVLGVRHGGCTATKGDCVAAFGSPTATGRYPYLHRGSEAYTAYV
jgi:hypothetical protein